MANDAATRRVTIDGFEQTRNASVDADAAVFLFDAAPRADEIEFLNRLPFTPLTTLGVLSRADSFGEGAWGRRIRSITHDSTRCGWARLGDVVSEVVPVSGLMAQTSHTGLLTERHAASLARLHGVGRLDVLRIFDSADPAAGPIPPAERVELLGLLGEYGVLNGRGIAAGGGAAALNAWLTDRSGLAALRRALRASTARFAVLHRAHRILARLDRLAFDHPARDHIRTIAATCAPIPRCCP